MLLLIVVGLLSSALGGDICPPHGTLPACKCRNIVLEDGRPLPPNATSSPPYPAPKLPAAAALYRAPRLGRRSLYTLVSCAGFPSAQALEESVLQGLHRKSIDELVVSGLPPPKEHALAYLPDEWLKHVRVKQFEINESHLAGDFLWRGAPFAGQGGYLRLLTASRVSLCGALTHDAPGTTNTKGLSVLHRLEGLDLSQNHLSAVGPTAFRDPPSNLSSVNLSRNSLSSLDDGAFVAIESLACLDLSHNVIENVSRGIFANPAPMLAEINLSWNFIRSLPPDFFTGMPKLRVLNLSKNFLYSLPENPWKAVWGQLHTVDVSGNFIECYCDLLWMVPQNSTAVRSYYPTTTLAAVPSDDAPNPGKKVKGQCYSSKKPKYYTVYFNLATLTRKQLDC